MKYDTRQRETLYVSRSHANGAKGNVLILACSVGTRELLICGVEDFPETHYPGFLIREMICTCPKRYLLILAD
jgi:hypothetical protein